MERHVSEKVMAELGEVCEPFARSLLDGSLEKFRKGVRTQKKFTPKHLWPFVFQGKPLTGEFLVSTYLGGSYTVITTASYQWLVATDELDNGNRLRENHPHVANPCAFVLEPVDNVLPDGASRYRGMLRRKPYHH